MPKIKSNDANSAESESVGSDVGKIERQRLKSKKSKSESCIRTDLMKLCPNEGKKADLGKLFESYQSACVQMLCPWAGPTGIRIQAARRQRHLAAGPGPKPLGGQLDHTSSSRTRAQGAPRIPHRMAGPRRLGARRRMEETKARPPASGAKSLRLKFMAWLNPIRRSKTKRIGPRRGEGPGTRAGSSRGRKVPIRKQGNHVEP